MAFDVNSLEGLTIDVADFGNRATANASASDQTPVPGGTNTIILSSYGRSVSGITSVVLSNVQSATPGENGTIGTVDISEVINGNLVPITANVSIIGFVQDPVTGFQAILLGHGYDINAIGAQGTGGWNFLYVISATPLTGAPPVGSVVFQNPTDAGFTGSAFPQLGCLVAGTRILTPSGEIAVEDLVEGDEVITISGAAQRIIWVGHRSVDCRRHNQPEKVLPVRITAGAFADGVPSRDLFLSPDHAVFIAGDAGDGSRDALIPVQDLVNGTTIAQVQVERVSYHHIELERHDVVLAEGLTVETLLETGSRAAFANGGVPMQLHADFGAMMWEAASYAPLVVTGDLRDAAWQRLQQRASSLHQAEAQAA